jgi:26S proteasome regulatory subunit N12
MYPLIGLNLLRLLSQNRLSDFHTALETIDLDQLQSNQFIKQAVDLGKKININRDLISNVLIRNLLEQFLMEGSYNKVWSTRSTVQGEEFMFFYDILISTIR